MVTSQLVRIFCDDVAGARQVRGEVGVAGDRHVAHQVAVLVDLDVVAPHLVRHEPGGRRWLGERLRVGAGGAAPDRHDGASAERGCRRKRRDEGERTRHRHTHQGGPEPTRDTSSWRALTDIRGTALLLGACADAQSLVIPLDHDAVRLKHLRQMSWLRLATRHDTRTRPLTPLVPSGTIAGEASGSRGVLDPQRSGPGESHCPVRPARPTRRCLPSRVGASSKAPSRWPRWGPSRA